MKTDAEIELELEKIESILKSLDIEMRVGGCGCCESPWISFKYKGEVISDDLEDVFLDTFKK